MNNHKLLAAALLLSGTCGIKAGGLLTNTNQSVAFLRMVSREASIGIDGVYTNPAGVAFLPQGHHLSLNWQMAVQTRTIKNSYPLFTMNEGQPEAQHRFKGNAYAPIIPSIGYAYNWRDFSFQANLALTGGGGKCEFDRGLGSFEHIVANTALTTTRLAHSIDAASQQMGLGNPQVSALFPEGRYSMNSYMRGRQYFYGLSLGAAYRLIPNLSVFAGVRGVYAMSNYYGYVRQIAVDGTPLYRLLDPSRPESADIQLSCDQSGLGFTPLLGVDYRLGRWNFSAKYEFKTRLRLKNSSVNRTPSIGNLGGNLAAYGVSPDLLSSDAMQQQLGVIKQKFDASLSEAIDEYEDGRRVASDIPALLTVGVGCNPINSLRINAGFHYFYDCQAHSHKQRNRQLSRGTIEWNAGVEFDACKLVTVSAGWQTTDYGLTDAYMRDQSFVVDSHSLGGGLQIHPNKKIDIDLAYFLTLYEHKKTHTTDADTGQPYTAEYHRTNNVFGLSFNYRF